MRAAAGLAVVGLFCAALGPALVGCASHAPDDARASRGDAPASAAAPPNPLSAYEQQQRDRAIASARQRHLADAAIAWELLTVLRPDVPEYRERLADTQRQIDVAVAERLPRAAQAAQRGEIETATQLYLAVLALQPLNDGAAEALRALERERNKRNFLGKSSRTTLTRRAIADAEMSAAPAARGSALAGRAELEQAALLAGDGEFDAAIDLLEHRLALDPKDGPARRALADVYYSKAESLLPRDRAAAVEALRKSEQTLPARTRASKRLRQLDGAASAPVGAGAAAVSSTPAGATAVR